MGITGHIHIADRNVALKFGAWLFEWFEKDRLRTSASFLDETLEEVTKRETLKHVYLDYNKLGDLDMIRLLKEIERDTLLVGEIGDDMGHLPGEKTDWTKYPA
jgi:hypothetical protein